MTLLDYSDWLTDGNEIIDPSESARCETVNNDTMIILSAKTGKRFSVISDVATYATDSRQDALEHAQEWPDDSVRVYDRFFLLQWLEKK